METYIAISQFVDVERTLANLRLWIDQRNNHIKAFLRSSNPEQRAQDKAAADYCSEQISTLLGLNIKTSCQKIPQEKTFKRCFVEGFSQKDLKQLSSTDLTGDAD